MLTCKVDPPMIAVGRPNCGDIDPSAEVAPPCRLVLPTDMCSIIPGSGWGGMEHCANGDAGLELDKYPKQDRSGRLGRAERTWLRSISGGDDKGEACAWLLVHG